MSTYVSAELRRFVEGRANHVCEYCLIHADDTYLGCQVDHIISEKHGGPTEAENLGLSCTFCNQAKGSDIGSISGTGEFIRFFNPRIDRWSDHFALNGSLIEPRSAIGEVTVQILAFNTTERVIERETLMQAGRYPPLEALALIG